MPNSLTAPDSFEPLLGSRRGSDSTPWERMPSAEARLAALAARRRFIVDVVHYDGGQYVPDSELVRARLRAIAASVRSYDCAALALILAVEERAGAESDLVSALAEAALARAREEYSHWLACGHGPSVSEHGPVVAIYGEQNRRICGDCAVARELAAMRSTDTLGAYLNGDSRSIGTCVGGILARVTRCWTSSGHYRTYWRAVDEAGGRWHGSACDGPGSATTMHRSKAKR
jgi:hypothetical protein